MDGYSRAYRDPKSPLTPLTPLSTNAAFTYNCGSSNQRTPQGPKFTPSCPKRNANHFLEIRDVFERGPSRVYVPSPQERHSISSTKDPNRKCQCGKRNCKDTYALSAASRNSVGSNYSTASSSSRSSCGSAYTAGSSYSQSSRASTRTRDSGRYIKSSPVAQQSLSPRTSDILNRSGLSKYNSVFEREEIDCQVFCSLKINDLFELGVKCPVDQQDLMTAVRLARALFE